MRATTIWQAYRRASALANWSVWDRKARRNEVAFQKRMEKIVAEYDAMKAEKQPPRFVDITARTVA